MKDKQQNLEETIEFVEKLKYRWMTTVDAIVDPIMIIDKDYRILQTNKAIANKSKTEIRSIVNQKCYEVFSKRSSPCPGCLAHKTFESSSNTEFELEQSEGQRVFEVTSQPLLDENNRVEASLQIYRDRTMARRMKHRLVQNEKLASIGLLAGGVAHELNNPLGGILVFSQMLQREMDEGNPFKEYVDEIENSAKRCKDIVNNLLAFARQQPQSVDLSAVEISSCIESALKFAFVEQNSNEDIMTELALEQPLFVMAERNQLIQIFLNIIMNALHAMPNGGKLYIQSEAVNSQVIIKIEDSGIGIPPEEVERIFDPFYTTKPEDQGTGLGLSICHGIAEDLGGSIEVTSSIGKGSCFTLTFPQSQNKQATI